MSDIDNKNNNSNSKDVNLKTDSKEAKTDASSKKTTDKDKNISEEAQKIMKNAQELEAVFDVPVKVTAVLGRAKIEVDQLLQLMKGSVITLDRKIGEAIDIFVNDRLIARGEVVVVNEKLGVTMTEIIKVE